ncbi:hypothetical protein FRC07_006154, partial [Ceratobasidium sp. 392]
SLQVTSGLTYLHDLGVIHHASKAVGNFRETSNVEVDSSEVTKLGGFDSCFDKLTTGYLTKSIETSLWWMSSEQLLGIPDHSFESNIYALGMTILEIFTGKPPYAEIPNLASLVHQVVTNKVLPRRPFWLTPGSSKTDNELWQLLLGC